MKVEIDGVKFVPENTAIEGRVWPKDIIAATPEKQDIREYCKDHRVWAAKEGSGSWWGWTRKPETKNNPSPKTWNSCFGEVCSLPEDLIFPSVPWDKSLIAPDGSMPLWEKDEASSAEEWGKMFESMAYKLYSKDAKTGKIYERATHFEVGKWYLNVGENKGIDLEFRNKYRFVDSKPHKCTKTENLCVEFDGNGGLNEWNPADWIEVDAPKEEKKKPRRGDPIFVWDDEADDTIPASVMYFHHFEKKEVFVFDEGVEGEDGCSYDNYRPFDASLVGVPRKSWPRE